MRAGADDLELGEARLVEEAGRASRVASASAPMAGDQFAPGPAARPQRLVAAAAFDSNQFTRSQPAFSPKAAPSAARRG